MWMRVLFRVIILSLGLVRLIVVARRVFLLSVTWMSLEMLL